MFGNNLPMADGFIFFASAVFDFDILFLETNWKTLFRKLCASHFYTWNSMFTLYRITHFVGPLYLLYSELIENVFWVSFGLWIP